MGESSKAASPKTDRHPLSKRKMSLVGVLVVMSFVGLRAGSEWSMMSQFGLDPQMPIWGIFMVVKLALWATAGAIATGFLVVAWRSRYGKPVALLLFGIWAVAICAASWGYQRARSALADASDASTSAERLQALVHFDGIQAGYELDNRIAIHSNTPQQALRELHERGQLGTQMTLARNPNTPEDILRNLVNHESSHVRESLAWNPKLPASVRQALENATDEKLRKLAPKQPS